MRKSRVFADGSILRHYLIPRVVFMLGCVFLVACGKTPVPVFPSAHLSLHGPPLAVAGIMEGHYFSGHMERSCMAGAGRMVLQNQTLGLLCKGGTDNPASEKGRMYAYLSCAGNKTMRVAYRNLGPDQGVGIGRFEENGPVLVLYYHPWEDEAKRRVYELASKMLQGGNERQGDAVE